MKIDHEKASQVLKEAARSEEPIPDVWIDLVARLSRACERAPKTHIAMLGTAILAKATNPRVNVRTLKVSAGVPGAYSARSLAQHVLAAMAPALSIDLGVTGREPLNNQPYFGKKDLDEASEKLRGDAEVPFKIMLEGIQLLEAGDERDARAALRAFIRGRARTPPPTLDGDAMIRVTPSELAAIVAEFTGEDSEGGKRAQAVAAGFLDQLYGPERVLVDRINDPDRRFPGDVGVLDPEHPYSVVRVYEVRDKVVGVHDVSHFLVKAHEAQARWAAMVAVATGQPRLELGALVDAAFDRGISLAVYCGWLELLSSVLFNSGRPPRRVLESAGRDIYERLLEIEASIVGLQSWKAIVDTAVGD